MKRRAFLQAFALASAAAAGGAAMPPRYLRGIPQLVVGGVGHAVKPMPGVVHEAVYCYLMVNGHPVEVPGTIRGLLPSPAAC